MPKRTQLIAIVGTLLALLLCAVLIHLDRTALIHIYGYEAENPVTKSALSIKVRVQPLKGIRDEIPERVVGPPYSITMTVDCPQNVRELRLKGLVVNRFDGGSEDCRIIVDGGVPQSRTIVLDATLSEGEWGEHISVIATLELTTKDQNVELRVEFPIQKSHRRVLKLPMI